ncbi:hypothetical protein Q5752_003174 [Cryptotrichosporon argae]
MQRDVKIALNPFLPTPPNEPILPAHQATVYIPNPIHPVALEYACSRFGRVLVSFDVDGFQEDQSSKPRAPEHMPATQAYLLADGIVARAFRLDASALDLATRLIGIAIVGVGYDGVDVETCRRRRVAVTNCPGANAQPVAELTLALALALLRKVPALDRRLRSGGSALAFDNLGIGLRGKHVGLVGMGATARTVADIFHHAFACTVHVFSPTSPPTRWSTPDPAGALPHTRHATLEAMLPHTDVLCLHCPLTPATRGMVSGSQLALMKPSSVLVNMSRGAVVDEAALAHALAAGTIAGAASDVFEVEPVQRHAAHGLFDLDTFVGTPHIGGSTVEAQIDVCVQAIDQLADFLNGAPVANRVC